MSNIGRWMYLKLRILSMVSFGTAVGTFGALRNALKSCQLSTIYNYVILCYYIIHLIYLRISTSDLPENIDKVLWIFINKKDSILVKLLLNLSLNYIRQPENRIGRSRNSKIMS